MKPLRAALAAALLLSGSPGRAAEAPAAEPPEAGTFTAPPASASKADAALWQRAKDVNVRVPVERGVSTRLQAQVNGSLWQERLAEGVRRGTLDAQRAAELTSQLHDRWNMLALVLSSRWPVDPTRVCGYPWIDFDNVLQAEDAPLRSRELLQARARLEECVEKAAAAVAALKYANDEYRAAFDAIDRQAPAVPPAGAAKAAPAPAQPRGSVAAGGAPVGDAK